MREPAAAFSPLPLRARSVVELLDTSVKVYKQYFWVLLAWSALINLLSVLTSCVWFLATPIFLGVAACCVAAAVRGQNVSFKQCWQFAQSRFGGMLGWYLLTMLIIFAVMFVLSALSIGAGVYLFAFFSSATSTTQGVSATVYFVSVAVILSIVSIGLFTWGHIAPVVVCMEENNPNKSILRRSWDLMQGNWMRATSLMTILTLAAFALWAMFLAAGALVMGFDKVQQAFSGAYSPGFWTIFGVIMSSYLLVFTLFMPAFLLAIVLFYLDIRVRKDALDLEWTTHVTAPPASQNAPLAPTISAPVSPANAPIGAAIPIGFENVAPSVPAAPLQTAPTTPMQPPPVVPSANIFEIPPAAPQPDASPWSQAVENADEETKPSETVAAWQSLIEEPTPVVPASNTAEVNEITCPACGKKSPANYLFCMGCGQSLSGAANPTTNTIPQAPPDTSSNAPSNALRW